MEFAFTSRSLPWSSCSESESCLVAFRFVTRSISALGLAIGQTEKAANDFHFSTRFTQNERAADRDCAGNLRSGAERPRRRQRRAREGGTGCAPVFLATDAPGPFRLRSRPRRHEIKGAERRHQKEAHYRSNQGHKGISPRRRIDQGNQARRLHLDSRYAPPQHAHSAIKIDEKSLF